MKKHILLMFMAFAFLACSKSEKKETVIQSTAKFESETELFLNQDLSLVNNSENASTYIWDFGDGTKSTEKQPNHKYATAGSYLVKLSTNGNSNISKNVTVHNNTHSVIIKNTSVKDFSFILFNRIDSNTIGTDRFNTGLIVSGKQSLPYFTNATKIGVGGDYFGLNFVIISPRAYTCEVGKVNYITITNNTLLTPGIKVP